MYRYAMRSHILVAFAISLLIPASEHAMQQNQQQGKATPLIAASAILLAGAGLSWLVYRSLGTPSITHAPSRQSDGSSSVQQTASSASTVSLTRAPDTSLTASPHASSSPSLSVSSEPELLSAADATKDLFAIACGCSWHVDYNELSKLRSEADIHAIDQETRLTPFEASVQSSATRLFSNYRVAYWLVTNGVEVRPQALERIHSTEKSLKKILSGFLPQVTTDEHVLNIIENDMKEDHDDIETYLSMWQERLLNNPKPSTQISQGFLAQKLAIVRGSIVVQAVKKGDLKRAGAMLDRRTSVNAAELKAAVEAQRWSIQAKLDDINRFDQAVQKYLNVQRSVEQTQSDAASQS
jgi:hypothetical protein